MIIDATNQIIGRIATHVAKSALIGEEVSIINCEKAVMAGRKVNTLEKYKRIQRMGTPAKGPFLPKRPERLVKRIIRGMIPYKTSRGRAAMARIKCYTGAPDFKENAIKIDGADVSKITSTRYITIKEICKELGGKVE